MIKGLLEGNITQQELLNLYEANITYKGLPKGINGFVFHYDGVYNIFINKYLPCYFKRSTILHELAHIELNHLEQSNNDLFAFKIKDYEDEADFYIEQIKANLSEIKDKERW